MSTDTIDAPTDTSVTRPAVPTLVTAVVRAAVVALVANIVVQILARVAGVETVVVPPGAAPVEVTPATIATMTIAPIVIGGVVLVVGSRLTAGAVRALPWVGLFIGLGTVVMPLSMGGDLAGRLVLAAMHVVTGVAWFVSVRRVRG